ncbi:MAG TPA: ATP-binding protein [Candidatus Limnocylindrales bacterium]|nr:ATP-binding protein [Candidatus Limnocylindrales bacterium]
MGPTIAQRRSWAPCHCLWHPDCADYKAIVHGYKDKWRDPLVGKMQSLSRTRRDSLVGPNFSSSTNLPRPVLDERFDRDRFSSLLPSSSVASVRVAQYEEALKTLARELTNVKENERQKIAEQLHDQFGQDLVLAKMKLGQLLEKLPPQYIGCAEEIEEIIGELIHHTRAVINELHPEQLYETGLTAALQSLAKEIQTKHGIICTAKIDLTPKELKDEVQQVLLRAVRELLFNVVKHARASRVKIVMTRKAGSVVTEVCDDGQGFDRHKTVLSDLSIGRFGLFSVRARLAPLRGHLRIFSNVGKGTRAMITLPIDRAC